MRLIKAMDLRLIEHWLDGLLHKLDPVKYLKGSFIDEVYTKSLKYIDYENQTHEPPYDDFLDYLKGAGQDTSEVRTLWGYYTSMVYSKNIIEAKHDGAKHILFLQWRDSLKFHLNDPRTHCHFGNILGYHLQAKMSHISESIYQWSKKNVYFSMVDQIEKYIPINIDFEYHPDSKEVMAESTKEMLDKLDYLDEFAGLEKVYIKNGDGIDWPDFWRVKFILENMDKELNKGAGGPRPKIIKHLGKNGYDEFCQDLNHHIQHSNCLDDDLIKTWELSGCILRQKKYEGCSIEQDALNKFIKSVFDSKWFMRESKFNLSEIVKYNDRYCLILPNN